MKIFGINFTTKKELEAINSTLEHRVSKLEGIIKSMRKDFPFDLGQTVYDIQLRNDKGRYVNKNASLEHSRISEVIVDNKNYFGLVERYNNNDVFFDYESANAHLKKVCV